MPRLISAINSGSGAVGIASDGVDLGNMKKIDYLITRVGNTTINNTQNIQINSYGNEDLSHITEQLKTELLRSPYLMIPKFIEQVHFNSNKPENQNICIPNKKDNIIKVFTGKKWVYQDKEQVLNDLVDGKYFILDNHYEDNRNLLKDSEIDYVIEIFNKIIDEIGL